METEITKKTFIIDDDPFWIAILSELLFGLGFTDIATFSSGSEAFASMEQNPELVFLDYQLEHEDGLNILQQLKAHNSEIGVVFCTAYEDLGVAVQALNYGSFEYLLKSNASSSELMAILDHVSV